MLRLEGIPLSPGYARGIAVVYDYEVEPKLQLPHRASSNFGVESKSTRLRDALERSNEDLPLVETTALSDPNLAESAQRLPSEAIEPAKSRVLAIVSEHGGQSSHTAALVEELRCNSQQARDTLPTKRFAAGDLPKYGSCSRNDARAEP